MSDTAPNTLVYSDGREVRISDLTDREIGGRSRMPRHIRTNVVDIRGPRPCRPSKDRRS